MNLARIGTGIVDQLWPGNGPLPSPILMYHVIADHPVRWGFRAPLHTSPARFRQQVECLREEGYSAVRVADYGDAGGKGRGAPKVALTFDDGTRDFETTAFPVLREAGFTCTVFLPVGLIGDPAGRYLSWKGVADLDSAGVEFGSHTVTHPQLLRLPPRQVEDEVRRSKEILEDRLGKPVTSFSYPFAFPQNRARFTRMVRGFLASAGYTRGVTTRIGVNGRVRDPLFLDRIPIDDRDDRRYFRQKLRGRYDWMGIPQAAFKLLRGL